jgi:hypothetical protein
MEIPNLLEPNNQIQCAFVHRPRSRRRSAVQAPRRDSVFLAYAGSCLDYWRLAGITEWPLCADCVEKLENREASKISQISRVGEFSDCKAL